jgi:dihydroorotate dehydrogenase electron transfer subunit
LTWQQCQAVISRRSELPHGHILLGLKAPPVAARARPGQFLHVRCGGDGWPLLRRPFSLAGILPAEGEVELLVRRVGKGTAWLASQPVGQVLDVLGPLGNGFPRPWQKQKQGDLLGVAGGVGVAPLVPALLEAARTGWDVGLLLGAQDAPGLLLVERLRASGIDVSTCTEDGSYGRQGLVTELLAERLPGASLVFACGPPGMLRVVREMTTAVECYFSLEERMACGVGACLGCACQSGDGYHLVCRDGPVFSAREVQL